MQHFDTRVEDFLDGALTNAEQLAFENDLAKDPELAAQLTLAREARARLSQIWAMETAENALKEQLQSINSPVFKAKQAEPQLQSRTPFRFHWWQAAAALAAILIIALVAIPSKEQRLYTQMRDFPEADFVSKGSDNIALLETANKAFNDKKYDQALPAFQSYLSTQPDNLKARLFAGFCQLEGKDFRSAEASFNALQNSVWEEEADWFLALTYLREKDTGRCREQLLQIKEGNSHFGEAGELLKKI